MSIDKSYSKDDNVKEGLYSYKNYLSSVVVLDKVKEYISYIFQNRIDREVIMFMWEYGGEFTADRLFEKVGTGGRDNFNKRLKWLADNHKVCRSKDETVKAAHRPRYIYKLHPEVIQDLSDVRGWGHIVNIIRTARKTGHLAPFASIPDEAIIDELLAREERGIFIPRRRSEE